MVIETNIVEEGMTIEKYLYGRVNFSIPEELMESILAEREVEPSTPLRDVGYRQRRLCEASLYERIATSPSRVGEVSDSDNNWRHSDGGFSFSKADRDFYLSLANDIYEEFGMPVVGVKTRVRMVSYGIRRADFTFGGEPLPHII